MIDRHHIRKKVIYRAVNGAILACIALFMPFLGISAVTWKNILVLFIVLALLVGISILPARGKGLCTLLAVICLGILAAVYGMRTSYDFLRAYLQWSVGYQSEKAQWLEGFQLVQTAVITVVSFLVQILFEKLSFLKIILAFACGGGMLFCLLSQITLTHMGVVLALLYIVVVYVEWQQEHWEKKRSGSLKAQMIWLSPFLCIYLLLMAIMPAPDTPYDWQWAKDLYDQIEETFQKISQNILHGGREDFDTSLSGFSEAGELGSGIDKNDREVMRIQAQGNLATNVYLIGKVYDTFDGRQWLQEYHDDERERFIDTLETLYAVRRLEGGYFTDYLRETLLTIKFKSFNTQYAFAPLKTRGITEDGMALGYTFDGADVLFPGRKGYGTEYDVVYYQLNLGEELFVELLEADNNTDEVLWENVARQYEREIGQRITLEMVQTHRQKVYENYLDKIMLSKEVESYLSQITRDAETDLEKLQAIEKELCSYTYTWMPGELPDKVTNAEEFLDYFLLESRQGYCTYFATAFVLLARAEGFPTRYVQGFCVPMKDTGLEVTVLSDMAHAWPEVYIDDVGWIPFEPTPGYERLRYSSWRVSGRNSLSSDQAREEWDGKSPEDVPADLEENREAEQEIADQKPEEEWEQGRIWKVLAFGISGILAGFALLLILDISIGRYRYRRMSLAEKLKAEVRRNLRVLAWLGLKRENQETLQELRERGMIRPGLTSLCFIRDYEDVLYGGRKVTEEMLESVIKEREQLWKLLRKEKKLLYIFYRMRMM